MPVLSRQELFERAWDRPLTEVAAELGVTSTALKKICDKHDIPTPGRGYWAQVRAGKSFARPRLRPARNARLEEVSIVGAPQPPAPVLAAQAQARAQLAHVHQTPPAGAPPTEGDPEHPKLAPTRQALSRAKADSRGFLRVQGRGVLPMAIGQGSVERALSSLSRFLRMAEGQGAQFHRKDDGALLIVDGEEIPFRVEEKPERKPHVPTPAELAEKARRADWGYSPNSTPWRKYDESPSGKLSVMLETNSYSGLRRTFSESKNRSLERMAIEVLAGFAAHAALIKENRRKAEIAKREAQIRQERRERREAYESREQRRARFASLVAAKLKEQSELKTVLAYLESIEGEEAARVADMAAWVRRRLAESDARLSPRFLEFSARCAKIDFSEARAASAPPEPSWSYPRDFDLELWAVDDEANKATSQSTYDWARTQGFVPDLDAEANPNEP